ncbi:MAG TPA: class IV adenylate cyclase [Solirubrobacterales bacterium]|nr:class IV adenylate cyclase [Solirubrobacterales bacterium]
MKARDPDPENSVQVCRELGAESKGTLNQRDTYFEVPRGRLKLREEPGAVACLIAYERAELSGHKESRYRLIEVLEPAEIQDALAAVLGIAIVVSKARRLFLFEGVRIHLDHVEGLGDFIEFEGVAAGSGDPSKFAEVLDYLRRSFGIRNEDLLHVSYSELLRSAPAA